MDNITELVFGVILWLISCGFLLYVAGNKSQLKSTSKSDESLNNIDENNLQNENFLDVSNDQKLTIEELEVKIDDHKIENLEAELSKQNLELNVAKDRINDLLEELKSVSDQLKLTQDISIKLQEELESSQQMSLKLEEELELTQNKSLKLEKELQLTKNNFQQLEEKTKKQKQESEELKIKLNRQKKELTTEFAETIFEKLHCLLTNYPTARIMTKVKPDLPAKNLISLFKPLDSVSEYLGFNLIGKPWQKVAFNPQFHQADTEDIIAGELVYIRFVGYRYGHRILTPAKVSRTLPGKNQ